MDTPPLAFEDLLDTPGDGKRYEIIGGDLIVTPVPEPAHQEICSLLGYRFYGFVEANGLGLVYAASPGVRRYPHDIVVPDLVDGAPDLFVEALSPGTRARDLTEKAALYARAGVREYWVVDLRARSITVRAFEAGSETTVRESGVVRSTILPGFEVDVAGLFADLW